MLSIGKIRQVSAGEILIEEGSREPIFVVLLEGVCQVHKLTSERGLNQFREVMLRQVIAPTIFGEMSFLENNIHSTSVITITPCQIWELKAESFQQFLESDVNLHLFLTRSLNQVVVQRLVETETALAATLTPKDTAYLNRNETSLDEKVQQDIIEAIRNEPLSRYPDALSQDLVKKLSEYVKIKSEWLIICPGSALALDIIARAYISPAKKVTIVFPTFEVFPHCARLQKASIDAYSYPDPFKVDVADFLRHTDPASALIYIANPGNPTGLYHTLKEIAQIADERPQALFVIDEAYIEFGGESAISLLQHNPEQFILTRTLSKAFGLAGLRIGYIIAHPKLLAPISQFLIPYSTSRIAQIAACSILSNLDQIVAQQTIYEQRERMAFELRALGYRVEVGPTNFILVFVSEPNKVLSFFRRHNVLVNNSSSSHLGNCVRISVVNETATSKVIALAKQLKEVLVGQLINMA
ncbi:aminotransferase class I/II-fold pyridoxal phosphate-dependent enzyme [Nostoc sp.]|uniref:aminotransferase class I/II-fold pyridoxal phosphate-dependent enzyme n=1 Tax=Nostoc sp. TaxID=1180 RepID=UPI002FF576D7